MVKTKDNILTDYQNKISGQLQLIDELKNKLNKISFSRLGLFITEILIVALIINLGFEWFYGILLLAPLLLFLFLVKKQTVVQNELAYAGSLLWVYQNEADQLENGMNRYSDGKSYADEYHPYAADLDIYAAGSLYAFINRCNTYDGLKLLAANLGRPNEKTGILQRQEAIVELTNHIEQTFHFRAELQNHKPEQLQIIRNKLQQELPQELKFARNPTLRLYVKLVPLVTFGMLILGTVYGGLMWQFFALLLVFNAALTFFNLAHINKVYNGFSKGSALLDAYAGTIKWTEEVSWNSAYIKSFFNHAQSDRPVSKQIRQLSSIIRAFDARLNIIVSSVLNLFLLWDLRCSINLSNWHDQSSVQMIKGMQRISQFEELISFATLNYNQPDWNFPLIEDAFALNARDLGHPLIHENGRVVNDFEVTLQPTVDIVTGSNMAGKSTFLRTIGINMVLAFAGAPVCATQLSLSIFNILSYMRIKDSLNDHTSTFKAELNRLKMILDATQACQNSFVLIDEMLRGTNSRDKYLGSKVFIEKLIEQRTPALFATHDLQLSEMEADYPELVRNYHFDIQLSEGEMKFDYKLKHGPCKTFNAALLLKQIGLTLTP